jgi:uncharacterized protein (TIGR02145 family)
MKATHLISSLVLVVSVFSGCQKDEFAGIPVISTTQITEITGVLMASGGNITSDGGSTVTSRGIQWSTNPDQMTDFNKTSDGSGTGNFISNMSGLAGSTKYYVRAYATNSSGTAYGEQLTFTTRIIDIEGNEYHAIVIGTQTWMAENLKVTHLNDGSEINMISSDLEWYTSKTPAYCWYYNIVPQGGDNSPLYNFYTVNSGKLCPEGWSLPSDGEWKTLEMFLGMSQAEADMLNWRGDETSTQLKAVDGWYVLNGIQDMYGFKALPAGIRHGATGGFEGYNQGASWWSSSVYDGTNGWYRSISSGETTIYRGYQINQSGFSVRCIKND